MLVDNLRLSAIAGLFLAVNAPAGAAELAFDVRPVQVPLTPALAQMLTEPGCTETAREESLHVAWNDGRLTTLADENIPMALTLDLFPSLSVPVDPTVQTLLANVSGELRLGSGASERVWVIRQENYSVQLAKLTYWPDGRVIASLPVRLSQERTGELSYGHLAVFCSIAKTDALSCGGVKPVFSEAVADGRGLPRTIEQVLSDI